MACGCRRARVLVLSSDWTPNEPPCVRRHCAVFSCRYLPLTARLSSSRPRNLPTEQREVMCPGAAVADGRFFLHRRVDRWHPTPGRNRRLGSHVCWAKSRLSRMLWVRRSSSRRKTALLACLMTGMHGLHSHICCHFVQLHALCSSIRPLLCIWLPGFMGATPCDSAASPISDCKTRHFERVSWHGHLSASCCCYYTDWRTMLV